MVAHLILASYVAILAYHVVYSGTIGNRRTISTADIGATRSESSLRPADRTYSAIYMLQKHGCDPDDAPVSF